ncbi:MAG: SPFH domain-containing protein [Lachnospiraceae bacterium]|nr:SPFH domain-containing protein [Lachnospiraceae bacterium]
MALINVIKYEGDNNIFVWRHYKKDFNTMSQLIVHENQEAVLFKDGQALDLFPAGRYTLSTDNIPLLRTIIAIPTGGRSPFHCEVYYVNKSSHDDLFLMFKNVNNFIILGIDFFLAGLLQAKIEAFGLRSFLFLLHISDENGCRNHVFDTNNQGLCHFDTECLFRVMFFIDQRHEPVGFVSKQHEGYRFVSHFF